MPKVICNKVPPVSDSSQWVKGYFHASDVYDREISAENKYDTVLARIRAYKRDASQHYLFIDGMVDFLSHKKR